MVSKGFSYQMVGDNYGISKQRVFQIVQEYRETVTDDSYRDYLITQTEGVLEELLRIFRGPGKQVVTPGGSLVYEKNEDGSIDYSRPVYDPYAKADIADRIFKGIDRISKAGAYDRPKQRETDQSAEVNEWMTYVEQLAAENKALREQLTSPEITQGEIVD